MIIFISSVISCLQFLRVYLCSRYRCNT